MAFRVGDQAVLGHYGEMRSLASPSQAVLLNGRRDHLEQRSPSSAGLICRERLPLFND